MRGILKKLALLAVPVAAYFCVFAAFEPNNYFGLKVSTSSEAPVARLKASAADPGARKLVPGTKHFAVCLALCGWSRWLPDRPSTAFFL